MVPFQKKKYDKVKDRLYREDYQVVRKCLVMFELATMLLRLLEITSLECPQLFVSQEKELNITRLAELLLVVLSRVATGKEAESLRQILRDPAVSECFPQVSCHTSF